MTATIIAFPTMLERDNSEFFRTGQSSYIRIIDEAEELWDAALRRTGSRDALASRIDAFTRRVGLLEVKRPDVAGDMIALGCASIELRSIPQMLVEMIGRHETKCPQG